MMLRQSTPTPEKKALAYAGMYALTCTPRAAIVNFQLPQKMSAYDPSPEQVSDLRYEYATVYSAVVNIRRPGEPDLVAYRITSPTADFYYTPVTGWFFEKEQPQ